MEREEQFEMEDFSVTLALEICYVIMFLKLRKQRSRKKTWERDREKEIFKQHKNEGLRKRMPWFVPNNLGDTVEKQFILLKTLFLSWHQPKVRQLGYLPWLWKDLSQSRAQPTFLWWIIVLSNVSLPSLFSSSFCLIIFTEASRNICICVNDTLKLRMMA